MLYKEIQTYRVDKLDAREIDILLRKLVDDFRVMDALRSDKFMA